MSTTAASTGTSPGRWLRAATTESADVEGDLVAAAPLVARTAQDDQLRRALSDTPVSGFNAYEPDSPLANWIEPWWLEKEHRQLQRVMTMVATSDGYEYDFQMLMSRDGVRVVWKLGAFESRE